MRWCQARPREPLTKAKTSRPLLTPRKAASNWSHGTGTIYSEQVRKAKYDMDESEIKPYFELNNVLENGVFFAATQLYGITFKERKDIPVYNPEVRVFEVFDADGRPMALFYVDYFKRDNKSGGAWMSSFVDQSKLLGTLPVIYNVCNFSKPAPGEPALHQFPRCDNGLPRIRPRLAWHVLRLPISDSCRYGSAP